MPSQILMFQISIAKAFFNILSKKNLRLQFNIETDTFTKRITEIITKYLK